MSNVNNVPCKVISLPDVSAGADAIIADPSINSVQDFVGKTAGIEIATIGHLLFLQALAKNGVDPNSVKTVNMAADAATSALVAGKVPIAYSYEPFITQATKSGCCSNKRASLREELR
jgi:NitT/TauT family transport system substrate-binding protein